MKPVFTDFTSLIDKYRVILFDAYGVLNGAGGMIPGVVRVLRSLVDQKKTFFVVTNDSSHTIERMATRYEALGTPLVNPEQIICSGLIAQHYLERTHKDAVIAYLGEPASEHFLLSSAKKLIPLHTVPKVPSGVQVFALMGVGGYDWRSGLDRALNLIRSEPSIDLLAPNPDIIFAAREGEVGIAAGALAGLIERASHRKFHYFGKPFLEIFQFAFARAQAVAGTDLKHEEVLMVGDNIFTDIEGATEMGMHSALVLSGNTRESDLGALLSHAKHKPTYICQSIFS